jgi:NADH:ubiquinone oxidoreductase subunit E
MDTEKSAVIAEVSSMLKNIPHDRSQLLVALWQVFEHYQQLRPEIIDAVSQYMDIPYAEVYGVASFYALFNNPDGKRPLHVCTDVMCALQGAEELVEKSLALTKGTAVCVKDSPCLGQCDAAPTAFFGTRVLRHATLDSIAEAIRGDDDA